MSKGPQDEERKLTIGDFEDRFSIDHKGRLKYDGALVETAIGLKRRDFILAVTVAVFQLLNMIASWKNALKSASVPAPPQLICPVPIVNVVAPPSIIPNKPAATH